MFQEPGKNNPYRYSDFHMSPICQGYVYIYFEYYTSIHAFKNKIQTCFYLIKKLETGKLELRNYIYILSGFRETIEFLLGKKCLGIFKVFFLFINFIRNKL